MATSTLYYPHAIVLPSGVEVVQLEDMTPAQNIRDILGFSTGDPLPSYSGSEDATPDLTFSSSQLADLLPLMTIYGCMADLSAGNVDIEYRSGNNRGAREAIASAEHIRGRMASNAAMVLQSLSATQGGRATGRFRVLPLWDGTNDPIQWTSGVAVTATDKVQHYYTMGPIKLNGSFVGSVTSMNWENNVRLNEMSSDGEVYPTFADVDSLAPTVNFRVRNTALHATYKNGAALTALIVYLRKKLSSGYNVADATAQHIALTAAAGTVKSRQISGRELEISCQLTQSAGAVYTISAASAIA